MTQRVWIVRVAGVVILLVIFAVGMIIGTIFRHHRPAPAHPYLMAAFLDVGAGDCTLVRVQPRRAILIDTGAADAAPLVAQTLRQQGIRSLDLLVLASTTAGGIGGASSLIGSGIGIKQVWLCPGLAGANDIKDALQTRHIPYRIAQAGDGFTGDQATLTALWPTRSKAAQEGGSLVCRLVYGQTTFVLAASADAKAVSHLVADAGDNLDCDVLQVADGGADGATTPELLRLATPSIAVISCAGPGHPGELTLHRLEAAGAAVWRTDTQGAVTIFADGRAAPVVTAARMTGE